MIPFKMIVWVSKINTLTSRTSVVHTHTRNMSTHTHTYTHTHQYTLIKHMHTQNTCTYIHTKDTHKTSILTPKYRHIHKYKWHAHTYMCTKHAHTHTHTHTHTHIYAYTLRDLLGIPKIYFLLWMNPLYTFVWPSFLQCLWLDRFTQLPAHYILLYMFWSKYWKNIQSPETFLPVAPNFIV